VIAYEPAPIDAVGDLGVDGVDSETADTHIAGRLTGPGIWG
jgi:hypothetical protein